MKNEAKTGWLQRLESPYPMFPENPAECIRGLQQAIGDDGGSQGTVFEALMWVRIGQIDPAHRIVESATRGLEAYIHGVIHRIEGDYWNAKYWFRQVRTPQLVGSLNRHILSRSPSGYLYPWGTAEFDPSAFVDVCESMACTRAVSSDSSSREFKALQVLALAEWEGLLCQVEAGT